MTAPAELRPPPDWAHLPRHWLTPPAGPIDLGYWGMGSWSDGMGFSMSTEYAWKLGYRYHSPCVPMLDDAATVERVAGIVRNLRNCGRSSEEIAAGVIRELMKGPPG